MLKVIKQANEINDGYFYTQKEIDKIVSELKSAISIFESKKVMVMPSNLGSTYKNRIQSTQNYWNNRLGNYSSFSEIDVINEEALNNFEAILDDIFTDLNKYLPENKKQQLASDKRNYKQGKQNIEDEANAEMEEIVRFFGAAGLGNAWDRGILEDQANFARETCYKLINRYM